ncbi:MAG: single-stranded DNA-binding protein [Nitrospirae bacterium]|nr:single-stranded DNA-binding protein [Nitrospirota bacterium]
MVSGTGRLTAKPELRYSGAGKAVATFRVAVNELIPGKKDPVASFFNVVSFGKAAERHAEKIEKGQLVEVHGRLRENRYVKDGQKRSRVEIVALSVMRLSKNGNGNGNGHTAEPPTEQDLPVEPE